MAELDRVLGGGIVPGSVILMAGEPGVGKSTLLLDVAARTARERRGVGSRGDGAGERGAGADDDGGVLYVTGEESASQVRLRAERIGALTPRLALAAETDLAHVLGHIDSHSPRLVIVDSVQTIASQAVEGSAGGVGQVREVAGALIAAAKRHHVPVVLVGHVTKDGSIAGPRVLEHLVDVVCQFEGERHSRLRLLRAVKNRYGPTDEVGCFDLSDTGIVGLADPSGLFLSGSPDSTPGTCATVVLEGRRPIPTEIQALVAPSSLANPMRRASGLDSARTAMTLAVLQARCGVGLGNRDVYVTTVGGARVHEPAVDLAVSLAVAGAAASRSVPPGTVAVGEVGLTGRLQATVGIARRLAEAARLGFRQAIVPRAGSDGLQAPAGLNVRPIDTLAEALGVLID